jgi:hypothetical protein
METMRSRYLVALLVLAVPELSTAQRVRPPIRPRTPDRPAEKPPLMPGIHNHMLYNRYALSRFSLEQYPMVSYLQTSGFLARGIPANYWALGDGTHIGFRATPSLTVSTDFTSAAFGAPFSLGSTDFGIRVKPWTNLRVTPFVDARLSWAYTAGSGTGSAVVPLMFMIRSAYGDFSTSSGHGGTLGLGAETRVHARFWLTTGLTHTRYSMTRRGFDPADGWRYTTDATRLSVGLKYNHGRWLDAPQ